MSSPPPPETPLSLAPVSRNGRSLATSTTSTSLVMLADPHSAAAEAYRSLAASLQFSGAAGAGRRLQTIGITSAAAGEGKSTTAANLAVALAEGGHQVIVVDADLRRSQQHHLFGVNPHDGLTSVLLADRPDLPLAETAVPSVRLLSSGPPLGNPLEALGSPRFDQVCSSARSQADFVVVDLAPAAALADAVVLAPRLDAVLLVVSAGRTRRDQARRAREQLERVGANLLGVVLVDVPGEDKLYTY